MKIAVCIKLVDGELNPFDACALEEALKIKDAEVFVVSMCPISAKEKLHSLTRLGVKKVYLLSDSVYAGSDTLATSYILSCFLSQHSFDLIFCGRQTIDGDTAQVGPCLATLMGVNLITNVMKIESVSNTVACETRMGQESAALPVLLTIERINTLRFPSIFSRLGEIEVLSNQEIGADAAKCGLNGSPTKVLKTFENTSGERNCKFISPQEFQVVFENALAQETVLEVKEETNQKLPCAWAIGKTVYEKATEIAEQVTLIEETNPYKIAELAKKQTPNIILWNADLWGRKNAPIVAALLHTGLCADCTKLEADGEQLLMYRPAKSGNIIAKIACRTKPQMATVRCEENSQSVVVSAGRGVKDDLTELREFACSLNAELGASRALVDTGAVPYSGQVGLTGKTINPKVYVAIGISGQAQHTCGFEGAETVIAINPDRDAPIFKFSDFGIVADFKTCYNSFLKTR